MPDPHFLDQIQQLTEEDLQPVLASIKDRFGAERTHLAASIAVHGSNMPQNVFSAGLKPANLIPPPSPVQRLWQIGLYPGTVTLFVGETGAGKSSILYNIAIHAALNQPIWGVPFQKGSPIRVLYIDPENAWRTCELRLERIGKGRPSNLWFHSGENVNLSDETQMEHLRMLLVQEQIDMLIIDPIANLFDTKNENDNAEAAKQMTSLTRISRATNCCIIAVHHTGRDDKGNYGRGATARLAAADVAFVLRARCDNPDDIDDTFRSTAPIREDLLRLQVAKNRIEGRSSLYLQMGGDEKFLLSSIAAWREAGQKQPPAESIAGARESIQICLGNNIWNTKPSIFEHCANDGYGPAAVNQALYELTDCGTVTTRNNRREYGLRGLMFDEAIPHTNPLTLITEAPENENWN